MKDLENLSADDRLFVAWYLGNMNDLRAGCRQLGVEYCPYFPDLYRAVMPALASKMLNIIDLLEAMGEE